MRYFLFILLTVWCTCSYSEITTTGRGATYNEALQDAKTYALEHDAGVFIIHKSTTTNDDHKQITKQYTGGVITDYSVLSADQAGDMYIVTIKATVKRNKNNTVESGKSPTDNKWRNDLNVIVNEQDKQNQFIDAFELGPMLIPTITKIKVELRHQQVELVAQYNLKWSPKFVSDLKEYMTKAGRPVKVQSNTSGWMIASTIVAVMDPTMLGTAFNVGRKMSTHAPEPVVYVVCFGKERKWAPSEDCTNLTTPIPTLSKPVYMQVNISYSDGRVVTKYLPIQEQLEQFVVNTVQGNRVYFLSSGEDRRFPNGAIIFSKGEYNGSFKFTLTPEEAKNLAGVDIAPLN